VREGKEMEGGNEKRYSKEMRRGGGGDSEEVVENKRNT
jgi:hypothetical protein